jgi:murein L,D-transpeptidase YcbB/YkuD
MPLSRAPRFGRLCGWVLLAAFLVVGPMPGAARASEPGARSFLAQAAPSAEAQALNEALRQLLADKARSLSALGLGEMASLEAFYATRRDEPVWVTTSGLSPLGNILRERLRRIAPVASLGLETPLEADDARAQRLDLQGLAERDVILSAAFLKGVIDPKAPEESPPDARLLRDLSVAADPRAVLERDLPVDPAFWRLRAAAAGYRELAAAGGWPAVPEGPKLELGDRDIRVEALRRRLSTSGDLDPSFASSDVFDGALDEAVRRFQRRHGLDDDGVVGKATLAALNLPIETRIETLAINLVRLLDPPRDWGPRYIAVNTAAASYRLVDNGVTLFEQPAVVGRPSWPTPRLDDLMTALEFNPYWTVPPRIARLELWPKIHTDPGYLARNDMRLVDGMIRQDPGPKNPLGVVKFVFPNRYDVYLHDTNNPSLFGRADRHLSHGCIRVPNARDLATYLLQADPSWTGERVTAAIEAGRNLRVILPRPIAVHLVYDTAWIAPDGTVEFRDDVYRRDAALSPQAANPEVALARSACPNQS